MSYDGAAGQVTHFRGGSSSPPGETLYFPQWSQDQRYIAFWYAESMTVFDTETELATDYCLSSRYPNGNIFTWAPDGRQIAFDLKDDPDHELGRAVVLDISSGRAIQIASGLGVAGWMMTLP